ncbi:MAG: DUF4270 domain-containing protein [Sediminibacterium sp.]|nr:DUF4270 domain-containing protein [Sediminibacterium sp.]
MPKLFSKFLWLLISVSLFSCKKVDIRFGDQFLDNGYTQIIKVDTFNAELSTVHVDSFVTSARGVSLLGGYQDPYFGKITAQCFSEMIPPIFVDEFFGTTFDSICLLMVPNRTFYGDSTIPVTLNVHRVNQIINGYEEDLNNIYNNRQFTVDPTALGSKTVYVRPLRRDSIKIRLSDDLGREFLSKLKNPNDKDMRTTDAFVKYFNGIRVSASGSNGFAFGCKDSLVIRMYYKKPDLFLLNKNYDITIGAKFHHYNQISVDRSGTVLKDLATKRQLLSTETGNAAYSSYIAGAITKIRFNSIRDILKIPNYTKIIRASLIVRPLRGSYTPNFALPPQVRLSSTTLQNQIGYDLAFFVNGSSNPQYGSLELDYLYGENTNYAYDVTNYISLLIDQPTLGINGLLMLPPSPAMETTFNRLAVGNRSNNLGKVELLIVYAAVK